MRPKTLNLLLDRKAKRLKSFAVLVDPDHAEENHLSGVVREAERYKVDFLFVGGSLVTSSNFNETIRFLKGSTSIPVIIFPGSNLHIDENADAILLLSLISGRNPEFLIGQHVVAAAKLKTSKLEIIPTGYMLIDGGKPTTVSYISGTTPIPGDKPEIAAATAIAGELLGMRLIYLDAGSGALNPVSSEMIQKLRNVVDSPIVVGGGINDAEKAKTSWKAGADLVVIGNGIESDLDLIRQIAEAREKNF